jgi:hypothetical protein
MTNQSRTVRYTGILATPIERMPDALVMGLMSNGQREKFDKRRAAEISDRVTALFRHYEVEHGNFVKLAFALAEAHVPGFRLADENISPKKRGGTPTVDYYGIGTAVLKLITEKRITKAAAYREVAKSKAFGDLSAASVGRYFKEIQRRTKTKEDSRQFLREQTERAGAKWWGEE